MVCSATTTDYKTYVQLHAGGTDSTDDSVQSCGYKINQLWKLQYNPGNTFYNVHVPNLEWYLVILQEEMWGEDEIDDVLEKLKVDDALKELRENQEVILKNQQAIKNSLSAIEGLLHKRLHKWAKEVAALPLVSAESAPSYSGSMSQTSSLEESPATLVSSTPIPGPFPSNTTLPSEVMSPPSSSVSPDRANSNGVAQMGEISQCSSVSRAENVRPSNGGNEEDVSAENLSSSFATYNGPIPRDLINVAAASSGNCKTFVFKLMDGMFHKKELARSTCCKQF